MKFRLIALALAALSAPVLATTTATVTTSGFDVTLKDLNTGDGVAPGITWDSYWYLYGNSSTQLQTGYHVVNYSWGNNLEATYGPSVNANLFAASPDTALSGGIVGGLGNLSVSMDASGKPTMSIQLTVGEGVSSYASTQFSRGFWLTAGTQVSFSTLVDRYLSGSAYTGSWSLPNGINGVPSHSWSNSGLSMSASNGSTNLNMYGSNDFIYNKSAYENVGDADQLKLTIRNNTATDQYYWFSVSASVNAAEQLDPTTAVPEPGTYALMALGLLGVAGAARRRKG